MPPKTGIRALPLPKNDLGGNHHLQFKIRISSPRKTRGHRFLLFQYQGLGSLRLQNRDLTLPSIREQDQGSSSLTNEAQGLLFPKRTRIKTPPPEKGL